MKQSRLTGIVRMLVLGALSVCAPHLCAAQTIPEAGVALAVNAGGPALDGAGYGADRFFVTGRVGATATPDATIFDTARWDYGGVRFEAPLPPGRYDVELHWVEDYHREPGRRVMDVVIEGETRLTNLDPLAAAQEQGTREVTRLIEGVDPATGGAPDILEVSFVTKVDAAAVHAIRILCADRAPDCATRWTDHAGAAWRGVWERRYLYTVERQSGDTLRDVPVREVATRVVSGSAGVLVDLDIGWLACEVVFSPGSEPADMRYLGDTCLSPAPLGGWALQAAEGGDLTLDFRSGDRPVTVTLNRSLTAMTGFAGLPADRAGDLAGVSLGARVAEVKAAVTSRFAPRDPSAPWRELPIADGILHLFESAEGGAQPVERFAIAAVGPGPDAAPFAVLRRWTPEAADRPRFGTLNAALEAKYGAVSGPVRQGETAEAAPQIGLAWSFDRTGAQILKGSCDGPVIARLDPPFASVLPEDAGPFQRVRDLHDGCGLMIEAVPGMIDGMGRVTALEMALTDASRLGPRRLAEATAGLAERIDDVLGRHAERLKLMERADAVQPRL